MNLPNLPSPQSLIPKTPATIPGLPATAPQAAATNSVIKNLGAVPTITPTATTATKPATSAVVAHASPSTFSIDVSKPVTSSAIQSAPTPSSVYSAANAYNAAQNYTPSLPTTNPNAAFQTEGTSSTEAASNPYEQYAQQLASATQLSPDYLAALKGVQDANLKAQQDQVNGMYRGDTLGFATGATARQEQIDALNTMAANNSLSLQQAIRQGNINAEQALVQAYQPTSVSPGSSLVSPATGSDIYNGLGGYEAVQGIQTVVNLAQEFPDAGIQPTDTLPVAQQKAASAPSFQSRNLVQVTLPGGGISFINRNQIVTDPNTGSYSVITPEQATAASAASEAVKTLTDQRSQIASALATADTNFPILTGIVQKYNLNTGIPLQNQLQQKLGGELGQTAITQLNSIATGLKATIAQIVARGGSVDDKTRNEADALLPTDVSYSVLKDLYNVVQKEGQGVLDGFDSQISQQNTTLNNIYSSGQSLNGNAAQTSAGAMTPAQPSGNPFAATTGAFF